MGTNMYRIVKGPVHDRFHEKLSGLFSIEPQQFFHPFEIHFFLILGCQTHKIKVIYDRLA